LVPISEIEYLGKPLAEQQILIGIGIRDLGPNHEHPGQLMEVRDEDDRTLNAAWVWDDVEKKIVACVFDGAKWRAKRAKRWTQESLATAKIDAEVRLLGAPSGEDEVPQTMLAKFSDIVERVMLDVLKEGPLPHAAFPSHADPAPGEAQSELVTDGAVPVAEEVGGEGDSTLAAQPAETQNAVAFSAGNLSPFRDADDGKSTVWKCIWRTGTAVNPVTGESTLITQDMLQSAHDSFGHVVEHVDIPLGHKLDDPESNTGRVDELDLRADGNELWAKLRFTRKDIFERVKDGSILDVSVAAIPNPHDRVNPRQRYAWGLWHVALTNKPKVGGLGAFVFSVQPEPQEVQEPAPVAPIVEESMSDNQTVDLSALVLKEFGVDLETLKKQQENAARLTDQVKVLAATARERRIDAICFGLEGKIEADGVTIIEGYRHAPAVVESVRNALKNAPQVATFSVSIDGLADFDALLLSVVNAIPAEMRVRTTADAVVSNSRTENAPEHKPTNASYAEDDVERFLTKLGG
jgi:hypothetical protein